MNNTQMPIYKCHVVDISTFIESDEFLGKSTKNGNLIFPFWRDFLRNEWDENKHLFSCGGMATGKTEIGLIISLYKLYKICCLTEPIKHYNLAMVEYPVITVGIFNKVGTLETVRNRLIHYLSNSEWFKENGDIITNSVHDIIWEEKNTRICIILTHKPESEPYFYYPHIYLNGYKLSGNDFNLDNVKPAFTANTFTTIYAESMWKNEFSKYKIEENFQTVDLITWNINNYYNSSTYFKVAYNKERVIVLEPDKDIPDGDYTIISVPDSLKPEFTIDGVGCLQKYCGLFKLVWKTKTNLTFFEAVKLLDELDNPIMFYTKPDIGIRKLNAGLYVSEEETGKHYPLTTFNISKVANSVKFDDKNWKVTYSEKGE